MLYSREERRLLSVPDILRKAADRVRRGVLPPVQPELAALIAHYGRTGDAPALLFFGDSVLDRVSRWDDDRRSLRLLLEQAAASLGGGLALGRPAFHPRVFLAMLRAALALPLRPRALVVAVNLRCFSPQWDLHPDWQFEREIVAFERFARCPSDRAPRLRPYRASRLAMNAYDEVSVEYLEGAFDTIGGYRRLIASKPADEEGKRFRRAQIFVYHYLFRLSPDHRQIGALRDLLDLARAADLPVQLYLTPINLEGGRRLVGPAFLRRVAENVAVLKYALGSSLDRPLLDQTSLVPSEGFLYLDDPTEHLNEHGRRLLIDALRPSLPDLASDHAVTSLR